MLTQGYYFGDKADLWSIGCILLELALGMPNTHVSSWNYTHDDDSI